MYFVALLSTYRYSQIKLNEGNHGNILLLEINWDYRPLFLIHEEGTFCLHGDTPISYSIAL